MRVSLCQTAMLIYRQGKIANLPDDLSLSVDEIARLSQQSTCHLGHIRHLAPVLQLSETAPRWTLPTPKLGSDKPAWL